jgi:hypothetical protein
MNEFLELFGGPIAVVSSIITTWIISKRWKTYRHSSTRTFFVPILYWGPLFLISCMFLHCFRNGYNTIIALSANMKAFNFYYYSLQMFGGVLAYQSYLLLQKCKEHVSGELRYNRGLYRSMLIIIATSLPTFIFTPIGIVPAIVLAITFISSLFVHKKKTKKDMEVVCVAAMEAVQLN